MVNKIFTYLKLVFISARPTTWIRIFSEMFLGFVFTRDLSSVNFLRFLLGFISAGPFLWTGAYMLNDVTDIPYDIQHKFRSKRPITDKSLSIKTAVKFVIILFTLAIIVGFSLNIKFAIGLCILIISQFLYSVAPFRLKEKFPFDMLLNGINGGARFILGFLTVEENLVNLPILFLFFAVSLKLILFLGHRMQNRKIELTNKFHSTVAILTISQLKKLLFLFIILTIFFYILSVIIYQLGFLLFLPPVVFCILLLPILIRIKKGYLQQEEGNLFWRVYLYLILSLFSILVFGLVKFKSLTSF